jgi:hypothetical protein
MMGQWEDTNLTVFDYPIFHYSIIPIILLSIALALTGFLI